MWNRIPMIALACAMGLPALPAGAADKAGPVAVRFSPGATAASYNGRVRGSQTVDYRLNAQAGQAMTVRFRPGSRSVEYVVLPPGGDTPIHSSQAAGNEFTGTLQASGTYLVRVFLDRAAARRGASSSYTIAFGVDGQAGRAAEGPPPGPPARQDSTRPGPLGPDARVVAGLPRGDVLTVRTGPSYSSRTVQRFAEGTTLRSFGCQEVSGATWCRVGPLDAQAPAGWSSARYLREVAMPPGRESRVPGTPYQATGQVDCRFQGQPPVTCPFGVRRHGPQTATVDITLPGGQRRTLVFRSGQVTTEGRESVVASREGDGMVVTVGGDERYVIPDLVIRGD